MYRYIAFILSLLVTFSIQAQVKFEASVSSRKIVENSTVNIEFTLFNIDGSSFTPPNFDPLKIVGGPNQSTQMSFVNGRSTQQKSYSYSLLATKTGKYTIGSATIIANNKTLKTNPITIEVVASSESNIINAENEDAFVRIELSDSTAIIGQQIIVDYKLYTRVQVENYNFLNEPDYDGFFAVPLNRAREAATQQIIGGKEYYVQSLKKVSLFPQQTGTYEYDPVIATLGISDGTSTRRGFFMQRNVKNVNRTTNSIKIQVENAPKGAPLSYSGGVGKYQMRAGIDKRSITTDDAIKVNMIIQGSGDPKIVQAPDQDFGPELDVYEPNILREEQFVDKGYVSTDKEFEFLIVPKKTGRYTIQPKFSYFDPDSNQYQTLTAGPFTINVAQGTKALNTLETLQSDKELSALIPNPVYKAKSTSYFGSTIHFLILGLILAAIPLLFLQKRKLQKLANIDPKLIMKQNAEKIAIQKLSIAKSHLESNNTRAFYEEIQNGIFGYLSDRLEVPYSLMNKNDIKNILSDKNVPPSLIDNVEQVLQKAEMALFAGANAVGMQASYDHAKELILGLESHFSK